MFLNLGGLYRIAGELWLFLCVCWLIYLMFVVINSGDGYLFIYGCFGGGLFDYCFVLIDVVLSIVVWFIIVYWCLLPGFAYLIGFGFSWYLFDLWWDFCLLWHCCLFVYLHLLYGWFDCCGYGL